MSQAIISNNTTIKISAAVAASRSTPGVLYTCPANSYAIVQVHLISNGSVAIVSLGSMPIVSNYSGGTAGLVFGIYVGPGQSLNATMGTDQYGSYSGIANTSGVQFTNSP